MSSDPSEFIAEGFHTLVANLQSNELADFEKAAEDARLRAIELRQQQGQGLSASQLLQELVGDNPEQRQRKLDAESAKIEREAAAAVAEQQKKTDELPPDRFPAPVITT